MIVERRVADGVNYDVAPQTPKVLQLSYFNADGSNDAVLIEVGTHNIASATLTLSFNDGSKPELHAFKFDFNGNLVRGE